MRICTHSCTVGQGKKPHNSKAAHHTENEQMMLHFEAGDTKGEGNPERYHRSEVQAVEAMSQECPAGKLHSLGFLDRFWESLPVHHRE
jgi:hypothetical protein